MIKTITPWICEECKISNPESEDYCRKCGKELKKVSKIVEENDIQNQN